MLWIVCEENEAYSKDKDRARAYISARVKETLPHFNIDVFKEKLETLYCAPGRKDIGAIIRECDLSRSAIVSPQYPEDLGYSPMGFFSVVEIRGETFPYTEEQLDIGIKKEKILQTRLGLHIYKPTKTMADIAGADLLKKDIFSMLELEEARLFKFSGIFLFGVAGAGKTHFAECFAGETKRMFAYLDLPHFMSLPNPTRSIDEVFDFLLSQDEKYVLLIDEIEKMFDFSGGNLKATQVFGKLLTKLNDIHQNPNSNVTFIATANNITGIMANNPEFLRKGRFDRLYFLNYPSIENAAKIFTLFKNKRKKRVEEAIAQITKIAASGEGTLPDTVVTRALRAIPSRFLNEEGAARIAKCLFYDFRPERMVVYIEEYFQEKKLSDANSFVYTPPEIAAVVEELENIYLVNISKMIESGKIQWKTLLENEEFAPKLVLGEKEELFVWELIRMIVPLQISASSGIAKQLAQSRSFGKGGAEVKQFVEVS